jgi:hypothetical protein
MVDMRSLCSRVLVLYSLLITTAEQHTVFCGLDDNDGR